MRIWEIWETHLLFKTTYLPYHCFLLLRPIKFFKIRYILLPSLLLIGCQGRCRNCGLARQVKNEEKSKLNAVLFLFLSHLSFPQPPDTAPRSSGSSSRSRATRWILLLLQKNQHFNVGDVIFWPIKKTETILTRRPLSTLERSVRVAEAELVDETEVGPCYFVIGQTVVCGIGIDCA